MRPCVARDLDRNPEPSCWKSHSVALPRSLCLLVGLPLPLIHLYPLQRAPVLKAQLLPSARLVNSGRPKLLCS